jgi:glycosyltransferase involved in cell wall biosynthesis
VATNQQQRVTVIIPTYNRSEWLRGAIDSVLGQTRADFRVLVSDNASTDDTPEVVASYDDPRIEYVRQPRNLELNEHWNGCIARAETEYLFLLPDDDRMAPDLLERTVPVLDAHPRAGLVHGRVDVVDAAGAIIAAGHDMTGLERDTVESGHEFIRRSFDMSYRVHASTALIRTEALRDVRLEREDYPLTDLGLWMRVALRWDIAFVAHTLAAYTVHAASYSAGAADVTDGGYIQNVDRIVKAREVKLRLLREHGRGIAGARRLRARADRALRAELLVQAAHATVPDRRLRPTLRALGRCAAIDRAVALEPAAWKLFLGSVLGRRVVAAVKEVTA